MPIKIHNGFYTLTNPATGGHRTFRIKTQPQDSNFAPGERVVSLLVKQDNASDYLGIAFLFDAVKSEADPRMVVWKRHRNTVNETLAKLLLKTILQPDGKLLLNRESTCLRCNRLLTTPESVQAGYGPECSEALGLPWGELPSPELMAADLADSKSAIALSTSGAVKSGLLFV